MDPKGPEGGGARQTEAEPEETQHQVAVVPGSCCTSRIMHACSRHSVPRTPASKAAAEIIGHALKPDLKARSPVFEMPPLGTRLPALVQTITPQIYT